MSGGQQGDDPRGTAAVPDAPAAWAPGPVGPAGRESAPGVGAAPPSLSAGDSAEDAAGLWRRLAGRAVLLDGFHAVKHALRFGADVPVALAADVPGALGLAERLAPDLRDLLAARLVPTPLAVLRSLVPRPHPTGVAALAVRPSRAANLAVLGRLPRTAPLVLLDQPRHLGNAGAVVRLAAGCGATGVVTTGTLDPWHPSVVRGAAGLHFATAVERVEPEELPPGPVFALDAEGDDIRSVTLPDAAVLAFGSERSGLSPGVRARAERLVSLPMRPGVSSYNLATSVAMALFHWSARTTPPG